VTGVTLLGAVLAGGKSRRFGSDKALALLDGRTLLDHAVQWLRVRCDSVVVVGRETDAPQGVGFVSDWPRQGMGPLGGIAGALRRARDLGHGGVLTCGVDSPGLPAALPALLDPGPSFVEDQPVIGLWPIDVLPSLEAILAGSGKHSLRALAEATGARPVRPDGPTLNINHPEDLAGLGVIAPASARP